MITALIIGTFAALFQIIFGWLPQAGALPFGIEGYLSQGMGYLNFLFTIIPPLSIIYAGFIWLLGWKALLMILRLLHIF